MSVFTDKLDGFLKNRTGEADLYKGLQHDEALLVSNYVKHVRGNDYAGVQMLKNELAEIKTNPNTPRSSAILATELSMMATRHQITQRGDDPMRGVNTFGTDALDDSPPFDKMKAEISSLKSTGKTEEAEKLELQYNFLKRGRIEQARNANEYNETLKTKRKNSIELGMRDFHSDHEKTREDHEKRLGDQFDKSFQPQAVIATE